MNTARQMTLGVMPLTDAAPLIVGQAKGFFAEENLDITLAREVSWATIRDKVMFRAFDGAQMLAPMPLAMSFGLGHQPRATLAPLVLSLNGNGITIGRALKDRIDDLAPTSRENRPVRADGLALVISDRRERGLPRLRFGVVYPHSTHYLQLRAWLKEAAIEPDQDVDIVVVPPSQMAAELEAGRLDGYCVGEPWNQLAVRQGVGHLLITSQEISPNQAEKVLGIHPSVLERDPDGLNALLRGLIRTGQWLDRMDNRLEAAKILVEGAWVEAPIDVVGLSLLGVIAHNRDEAPRSIPDMHVFSRHDAWLDDAERYANAMVDAGQLEKQADLEDLQAICQPHLISEAAHALGLSMPSSNEGTEDDDQAHPAGDIAVENASILSSLDEEKTDKTQRYKENG